MTANKKTKNEKKCCNVVKRKGDLLVSPQSITNTTKDKAITLVSIQISAERLLCPTLLFKVFSIIKFFTSGCKYYIKHNPWYFLQFN